MPRWDGPLLFSAAMISLVGWACGSDPPPPAVVVPPPVTTATVALMSATTDRESDAGLGLHLSDGDEAAGASGDPIGLASVGDGGVVAASNRPTGAPTVRTGSPSVQGRLPPEVVARIVRQQAGHLKLCYDAGLKRNPQLSGKILLQFVIDRTGKVASVTAGLNSLPDRDVMTCIAHAISALSFPAPEGGVATVNYPIVLGPPPAKR